MVSAAGTKVPAEVKELKTWPRSSFREHSRHGV